MLRFRHRAESRRVIPSAQLAAFSAGSEHTDKAFPGQHLQREGLATERHIAECNQAAWPGNQPGHLHLAPDSGQPLIS